MNTNDQLDSIHPFTEAIAEVKNTDPKSDPTTWPGPWETISNEPSPLAEKTDEATALAEPADEIVVDDAEPNELALGGDHDGDVSTRMKANVIGTGGKLRRAANLASLIAIASAGANLEQVMGSKALGLGAKREPAPRTQADLDRLRAAEDRRQRRMARNLGQKVKK